MPIPKPRSNENREAFIDRCMSDAIMSAEYPDSRQRAAVCNAQLDKEKRMSDRMAMERKEFRFQEFKLLTEDDSEGTIEGYLSVFGNIDHDDDIVHKGAFADTLDEWSAKGLMPAMFWGHDTNEPIGEWTSMKEDDHGLRVKGVLWLRNPTEAVRKAYNLARSNTVKGLSIGYKTLDYAMGESDGIRVRHLRKLKLFEGSVAPFAANELASITAAKSLAWDGSPEDKKNVERILRDAGFSRREAKTLLANGYEGLLRDAGTTPPTQEVEDLKHSINDFRSKLKGA